MNARNGNQRNPFGERMQFQETGAFLRVVGKGRSPANSEATLEVWKPREWWITILSELCVASEKRVNPVQVCVQLMGHPTLGAMLYHVLYLSGRGARSDGFIWKSFPEWADEMCVSKHFFNRFNKECFPMVVARKDMAKGSATWHYRPTLPGMIARLADVLCLERDFIREKVTGHPMIVAGATDDSGVSSGGYVSLEGALSADATDDSGVSITSKTTIQTSDTTASENTQSTNEGVGWLDRDVLDLLEKEGANSASAVKALKGMGVNPEAVTADVVMRAVQATLVSRLRGDERFVGLLLHKVAEESKKPKGDSWANYDPSPALPAGEEGASPPLRLPTLLPQVVGGDGEGAENVGTVEGLRPAGDVELFSWRGFYEQLRYQLNRYEFDKWFKDLVLLGMDDGKDATFVVGCPNRYSFEMADGRYRRNIEKILFNIYRLRGVGDVAVRFVNMKPEAQDDKPLVRFVEKGVQG